MKKIFKPLAVVAALALSTSSFAQLQDEKNVTVTMDLQPILQLNMQGAENVDFVFDKISQYIGGITKYGATQLTVSSTVAWDLYAVGHSTNGLNNYWDQAATYGGTADPLAIDNLPISLLELHQNQANPGTFTTPATGNWRDYSTAFTLATGTVAAGQNSIYANVNPYTTPTIADKYIAGHAGTDNYMNGGSYLTQTNPVNNFKYIIDYRIVPGLPASFPWAGSNVGIPEDLQSVNGTGSYAQAGIYTMNVKYVLTENQ